MCLEGTELPVYLNLMLWTLAALWHGPLDYRVAALGALVIGVTAWVVNHGDLIRENKHG